MRIALLSVLSFIFSLSYSVESNDTTRTRLHATCTVTINTNGISTIPAFSLGEPAIMSFITLSKGRFSYDPVLAYGMDMRPWFIDNWLHYRIVDRESFILRTGVNFSVFFSDLKLPDKDVLQGERYWALELAGIYKISSRTILTLMYWNDRGQDQGTISGHFFSLTGEYNEMKIGRAINLSAALQVFYIDYDGNNDGLFLSPRISSSVKSIPLALFFQATQPLVTNISPDPGFEFNIGLQYTF